MRSIVAIHNNVSQLLMAVKCVHFYCIRGVWDTVVKANL